MFINFERWLYLMKKLIIIFSFFLFASFNINAIATPSVQQKTYSQGFYNMKDLNLSENIPYSVQNIDSHNGGLLIILDTNQIIQQVIRVSAQSPKYALIPLRSSYQFIIYGNVQLIFS